MTCLQIKTPLLSHQQAAVEKLRPYRVGALFQDPGTGKTLTALSLAAGRPEKVRRVVWFCPVAAKATIRHEALKHTTLGADDICVFGDRTSSSRLPDAYLYVIGTESLSGSDRVTLAAHAAITPDTLVVMDESDMLRTHSARRTLRATMLAREAWGRLVLTGTPVPEGVQNLYSQMRFLDPRILGYHSWYAFSQEHIVWDEDRRGQIAQVLNKDILARRIAPITFQVTRAECLDLPAQAWDDWVFSPSRAQMDAYAQAKWELLDSVDEEELDRTHVYRLLTALQQIASGFWNRREQAGGVAELLEFPSARLDTLEAAVRRIPAGEKVIVWCKYHYSLERVAARLAGLGGAECHHGRMSERSRAEALERWRQPDGPRFLIGTPGTGGRGLTLNESRWAFFYERGWSYSENYQAELRNHRIGTTGTVTYTDIMSELGIERRIAQAYANKSSLTQMFRTQVQGLSQQRFTKARAQELLS